MTTLTDKQAYKEKQRSELAKFKEGQAAELAKFKTAQGFKASLFNLLGLEPGYVGGLLYTARAVSFRTPAGGRSLTQALDMFSKFMIVPFHQIYTGSSTKLAPKHCGPKGEEKGGPFGAKIRVSHIRNSPKPTSASLNFFAEHEGNLLVVDIEFGTSYIGGCGELAPTLHRGHGQEYFSPNQDAEAWATKTLTYSNGTSLLGRDTADHAYLFGCVEGGLPEEGELSGKGTVLAEDCGALDALRQLAKDLGI